MLFNFNKNLLNKINQYKVRENKIDFPLCIFFLLDFSQLSGCLPSPLHKSLLLITDFSPVF